MQRALELLLEPKSKERTMDERIGFTFDEYYQEQ